MYYCVRRFDAAVNKSLSQDSDPIISSDSSDDSSEDNSSSRHTYIHPTSPAHRHTYMGSSTSLIHDDDLSTVNNNNYASGSSKMASHESKGDDSAHTYIHSHTPSYRTPADADSKVGMYVRMYVCIYVAPSFPS